MNSHTILSNLDLINLCENLGLPLIFCGSKDLIYLVPKSRRKNKFYIINLDGVEGGGTHWTCLSTFTNYEYYFDPFGVVAPNIIKRFKNDVKIKKLFYNDVQFQSKRSTVCGWLIIAWLHFLYNGIKLKTPLDKIIYDFNDLGFDADKQEKNNYNVLLKYINRIL